jgi:hypothetical protein
MARLRKQISTIPKSCFYLHKAPTHGKAPKFGEADEGTLAPDKIIHKHGRTQVRHHSILLNNSAEVPLQFEGNYFFRMSKPDTYSSSLFYLHLI